VDRREEATQESLAAMSALSEETLSVSGMLLAKVFGNQARGHHPLPAGEPTPT
jgi:ATP-binding cassette, subfamily B, bacterial